MKQIQTKNGIQAVYERFKRLEGLKNIIANNVLKLQ